MRSFFFILISVILNVAAAQSLQIDQDRLEQSWKTLKSYGHNSETLGNDRIAFSDYNVKALQMLQDKLEGLGMQVHRDAAGNLIADRKGKNNKLKPIAFGSHIDCVPNGGHYDGQVGTIGAIEVIETLVEKKYTTKHPLQLIIFSNEESGVFGSRALAGALTPSSLEVMTKSGYSNAEGIERLGGDASKVLSIAREHGSLHAFLELHIEQGGFLEEKGLNIGVVQGIVGLRWWDVTVKGVANHGGTTPMNKRYDALLAAAKFTQMINEVVNSHPGTQVGTVGRIQAFPGAPNVVPGRVELSLELRDLSEDKIDMLFAEIERKAHLIGKESGVRFEFKPISATGKAALTDPRIQDVIEASATELGYSNQRMPSGAGHDAQEMSHIAPTGMIFIPSRGGISHAPDEYSSFEDMANGVQLLLETILELDKKSL